MNKHFMTLMGGTDRELRIPANVLLEAVSALVEGARLSVRFVIEGESVRKGPRPAWLDAACAVDVTGLSAGSAVVALEVPTLGEADAAHFGAGGQATLFEEVDKGISNWTSVDLFSRVLASVTEDEATDVAADRPLLDACARFAHVAGGGFRGLRLEGLSWRAEPVTVSVEQAAIIERLRDATPPPRAARLAGTLDTISASRAKVVIKLEDGTTIPARLQDHDTEALRELFGKDVVVSGMAHFRASGKLLRLDVEAIEEVRTGQTVFRTAPIARGARPVFEAIEQGEASGVPAFFGTWPGDESEEDLIEAVREIE